MKEKLRDYIEMIFADAPDCRRTKELKEEMFANVCDKYDDLIREGKSEAAAYNISVASIGDISELLDSIRADEGESSDFGDRGDDKREIRFTTEEKEQIEKYRVRSGVMTSVAVALYILCWIPLVLITLITEAAGMDSGLGAIIGLTVMMLIIAVATALLIFKSFLKPLCLKGVRGKDIDDDDDDDDDAPRKNKKRRKNPTLKAVVNSLWGLTLVAFLIMGFAGGLWHPGWIIFLIMAAVENIIEAIFELAGKKYL